MPFYAASCGLQRIMKAFIWTFLAVLLSARWFGLLEFLLEFPDTVTSHRSFQSQLTESSSRSRV
jgi:hypothetical protein